jgi:hypothetical protein
MTEQTARSPEATNPSLAVVDPRIAELIAQEARRQATKLQLIPSENYASRAVMQACGSVLTNQYSEGYPGRRYYEGQQVIDQVELLAIQRAKELFGVEHANVQPYSGSPANLAIYLAYCQPGDTVMGMALPMGGHLTHGWNVSVTGKWFHAVQEPVVLTRPRQRPPPASRSRRLLDASLVPVAEIFRERQDTPDVVLGHAVGQRRHRRITLGRRLVEGRLIILDELVVLHSRVLEDLERLARRAELRGVRVVVKAAGPVLALQGGAVLAVGGALHRLHERPVCALLGGLLVDGQLGQRKRFKPLVGDRPAAQDRTAVGARSQAVLSPLQRLQAARELPGDRLVGLLQGPPVGAVDEVLGNLVGGGDTVVVGVHRRQEHLEPMALLAQQGTRPLLVHIWHQPPVVAFAGSPYRVPAP